jgi:hypothetical protein
MRMLVPTEDVKNDEDVKYVEHSPVGEDMCLLELIKVYSNKLIVRQQR